MLVALAAVAVLALLLTVVGVSGPVIVALAGAAVVLLVVGAVVQASDRG
jgi:hypothetical protein